MQKERSGASSNPPEDWYRQAFSLDYLNLYAHRNIEEAKQSIRTVIAEARIGMGPVLDLCCGFGRHLTALREVLPNPLIGCDLSQELLLHARHTVHVDAFLVQGDMRRIPFASGVFEAILSFFTSFGYFPDDAENLQVLREVHRTLRKGGLFLFDFLNAPHVRNTLVPESEEWFDGIRVKQKRWIDETQSTVNKRVQFFDEERLVREHYERVKLYSPERLQTFFQETGLCVETVFGDYAGNDYQENSPRLIFMARKR